MARGWEPRPDVADGQVKISGTRGQTVLVEAGRGRYTKRFELRANEYLELLAHAPEFVQLEGHAASLACDLASELTRVRPRLTAEAVAAALTAEDPALFAIGRRYTELRDLGNNRAEALALLNAEMYGDPNE